MFADELWVSVPTYTYVKVCMYVTYNYVSISPFQISVERYSYIFMANKHNIILVIYIHAYICMLHTNIHNYMYICISY